MASRIAAARSIDRANAAANRLFARVDKRITPLIARLDERMRPLNQRAKSAVDRLNKNTRLTQLRLRKTDAMCRPMVQRADAACRSAGRRAGVGVVLASKAIGRAGLRVYYRAAKKLEQKRRRDLEESFGRQSYAAAVEGKWDDVSATAAKTKAEVDAVDQKIEALDKKIEVLSNGESYPVVAGRSRDAEMAAGLARTSGTAASADFFPAVVVSVPMVNADDVKAALRRSDAAKARVSELLGRSWGPDRRGRYPSLDALVRDFLDGPGGAIDGKMPRERFERLVMRGGAPSSSTSSSDDESWVAVPEPETTKGEAI